MRAGLAAAITAAVALAGAQGARAQGMPALEQERVQIKELPPLSGGEAPSGPAQPQQQPQTQGAPAWAPPAPPPGAAFAPSAPSAPAGTWRGVSPQGLAALLDQAPKPQRSPALQEALAAALGSQDAEPGLAAARLAALYQAGLVDAAARAATGGDPVADAVQARALLAAGAPDAACGKAASLMERAEGRNDLARTVFVLRLVCDLAGGNANAAQLTVALARDRGVDAPFAFAVVEGLGGASRKPALPKSVAVEDYLLLTLAKQTPGADMAGRASPALLVFLARDASASGALRLEAADRAAQLDLIDGPTLAQAYRGAHFEPSEIAKILGEPQSSARQRALLFQAMSAASDAREKTKLLRALATSADKAGLARPLAQAVQPELGKIAPAPALIDFADTAVRLSALAGDGAAAERWLALADANAATRGLAGRWRVVLEVAGLGRPGDTQAALDNATELALAGALSPDLQHRLVTVLDALGYQVPIPLWEAASRTAQPSGGYLPETGFLSQLSEASQKGAPGQVLLLVTHALGPEGPGAAHLIALGDSVRALKAAGFEQAARGVAFEALLALMPAAGSQG